MAPPLRAHNAVPSEENPTLIGNSPPDDIGGPTAVRSDGVLGLMEKSETVLEPAFAVASRFAVGLTTIEPCENIASGPSGAAV